METQEEYRKRLSEVTNKYCEEREAERTQARRAETASDIVFMVAFIVFVLVIGSLEHVVDIFLSLLGG
jgi:anaerobic C4-dicarboxylate transporter